MLEGDVTVTGITVKRCEIRHNKDLIIAVDYRDMQ